MICSVDQVVVLDTRAAPDRASSSAGGSGLDSLIEAKSWNCHHADWPLPGSDLANSRVGASCHLGRLFGQVEVPVWTPDLGSD